MIIYIDHPTLGPQNTFTTDEVASSASYGTVENNDGFASGDLVIYGRLGNEKTECVTLTDVTNDNQIDHSGGTKFSHPVRTFVSQISYDQAEIYRATEQGGSYSLITTKDLAFDEPITIHDDTDGTTSSWYKIRYKNSSSSATSDYSDEVEGVGYTEESLRAMTDEILADFGDPNAEEVSRSRIRDYLNAAVRIIARKIATLYPERLKAYTTQALTSGTASYALPDRCLGLIRVDISFGSTSYSDAVKAVYTKSQMGYASTNWQETAPYITLRGNNFIVKPTPSSSSMAFLEYWEGPATMTDEADEHGLPYGGRDPLVAYGLYRTWMSKNQEKASGYKRDFEDLVDGYIEFIGQQPQAMNSISMEVVFGRELYDQD